jgi:hypothetical protein
MSSYYSYVATVSAGYVVPCCARARIGTLRTSSHIPEAEKILTLKSGDSPSLGVPERVRPAPERRPGTWHSQRTPGGLVPESCLAEAPVARRWAWAGINVWTAHESNGGLVNPV